MILYRKKGSKFFRRKKNKNLNKSGKNKKSRGGLRMREIWSNRN